MTLIEMGKRAKTAAAVLNTLSSSRKNEGLLAAADALLNRTWQIEAANETDMALARERHMSQGILDRLALNPARIQAMADG